MAVTNRRLRQRMLRSPSGTVGVDLTRRAIRVTNRAKQILTATRAVDFGRLRASIVWTDPEPTARGLKVAVGSNLAYSLPIHEGSGSPYAPPSWRIGHARGRIVPARRYLTRALPAARS